MKEALIRVILTGRTMPAPAAQQQKYTTMYLGHQMETIWSQYHPAATTPETYISSTSYFAQIEARARYFGHIAGFKMGEPFKKLNGKIGLSSFNNIV